MSRRPTLLLVAFIQLLAAVLNGVQYASTHQTINEIFLFIFSFTTGIFIAAALSEGRR